MQRDAGEHFGSVLRHRTSQRYGSGTAGQWHRDDFRGHAGARQVEQVVRRELRPVQRWRGTHIKNRSRFLAQIVSTAAVGGEQVDHALQSGRGERSRHHWLVRMLQDDKQPIEIADRAGRIVAHDGSGLRCELRQGFRNLDEAHQVASLGRPRFQGIGIEHLHAAGAGIEMHVVAAIMNGFLSLAVVQVEVARGRCQAISRLRLRNTRHAVH